MNAKNPTPAIAILLIAGGAIFGFFGALHAYYTLVDLRNPQWLVPADPSVREAMAHSAVRISGGGTDMWRAWVGFNFSHSLGLLLFGALAIWAGLRTNRLHAAMMPALILIGCVYLLLCLVYWFRDPAIGVAIASGCFAAAWVLSLI